MREDFDREWDEHSKHVLRELKQWRLEHPKATLAEMETALDERLDRLRSRLLSDTATASVATDWKEALPEERPRCPHCDIVLETRGSRERRLQSQGRDAVVLERQYGVCPACGAGLFPPG
jgi:RNA polymerase-binding transcription factor DksA